MLGDLTATTLTLFGAVIFFFASAGASAAYLTASEVFPMETRALCIAFFYAIGTAVGGISGPLLFGKLIDDASACKDITGIAIGYFIGAALMIAGGIVEAFLGVKAEGQSLENIAKPLTAEEEPTGGETSRRAAARLTTSREETTMPMPPPKALDRGPPRPPGLPRDGPDRPGPRGQRPAVPRSSPPGRCGVLGGRTLRPRARARGRRRPDRPRRGRDPAALRLGTVV